MAISDVTRSSYFDEQCRFVVVGMCSDFKTTYNFFISIGVSMLLSDLNRSTSTTVLLGFTWLYLALLVHRSASELMENSSTNRRRSDLPEEAPTQP